MKKRTSRLAVASLVLGIVIPVCFAGFLIMPIIRGELMISNAMKIGGKGTNIVLSIISANSKREAMGLTPFLFTRNLNISVADLRDESTSLIDKLDHRIKPFGSERIVFIQKGGAMQTLLRVHLINRAVFLRGPIFNSEINTNAKVLKAKGMPE